MPLPTYLTIHSCDSDLASELVPAVVAPGGSGSSASCTMPQLNAGEYTLKLSMNGYSLSGALKVCVYVSK